MQRRPAASTSPKSPPKPRPARTNGRRSAQELYELAHDLAGPISQLLREELRLDRERVGRLRDRSY